MHCTCRRYDDGRWDKRGEEGGGTSIVLVVAAAALCRHSFHQLSRERVPLSRSVSVALFFFFFVFFFSLVGWSDSFRHLKRTGGSFVSWDRRPDQNVRVAG
ncbi:hypothetical protein F4823DRAFT_600688 [Ustulina deusta]|nr:hypothetical protein F4823DRAFT_600688 [Ustulina deusta]